MPFVPSKYSAYGGQFQVLAAGRKSRADKSRCGLIRPRRDAVSTRARIAMLRTIVDWAAALFEAAGTFVMTVGALVALVLTLRDREASGIFKAFRYRLGRAIILGLELLVAADILRTISTQPTLTDVAILGGIVLIRTFLSFSL
ncbi:MAG TPA: DUF1622 domain-containing protein, partial [Polyangia bacterium]|nr:DUF1622 domain-containing protein [Polyangia bacterium]